MNCLLFRKIIYNGTTFFQLYKKVENFVPTVEFSDYNDREKKDYVYISEKDSMYNQFQNCLNLIYRDVNGHFELINRDLLNKISLQLENEKSENKSLNSVNNLNANTLIGKVNEDVLYQKRAINELVGILNFNNQILNSNIPLDIKIKAKSNILLHGLAGSGKRSIIESLEKNLTVPYADIYLSDDPNKVAINIMESLTKNTSDIQQIENGIVFVRDNFLELKNSSDENPFKILDYISRGCPVIYNDISYDFRKLTFVILYDDHTVTNENDDLLLQSIAYFANCQRIIKVNSLSRKQKLDILLNGKNSRLNIYRTLLNKYNKKLKIENKSLEYLVFSASKYDYGMTLINEIIDAIFKVTCRNGISNVYITKDIIDDCISEFVNVTNFSKEDNKNTINENDKMSFRDLYELVKSDICSQDFQVKRILYTILNNQNMANDETLEYPKRYIKNILLRGESGSGKTAIINSISKKLNIPFFQADATHYTESGYVGGDITDMLLGLYHEANDDLKKAERGILVIDEIDKKAGSGGKDGISREGVLNGLLKIIEGTKVPININNEGTVTKILFDTSRLTVICSGAFEGIETIRDERIGTGKKTIGFSDNVSKKADVITEIIDDDYVKYGMTRQFMARLGVIINLNKLDSHALKNIMINSNLSELRIQQEVYKHLGIEFVYEDDFYEELSKVAYNKKIGARGIEKAFQDLLTNIHIEDIDPNEYSKIIFTKDVVYNPNSIILVPCEKKLLKRK